MSYYIATAAPLDRRVVDCSDAEWAGIAKHALPNGFRYLVSIAHEIVEPVLIFLSDHCIMRKKVRSVGNTQQAYTDDLYEWFQFLNTAGLRWDEVDKSDIIQYREVLLTIASPLTRTRYANSTVRRRIGTIQRFYMWAMRMGLCDSLIDADSVGPSPIQRLSAGRSYGAVENDSQGLDLLPRKIEAETVDAISAADLARIFDKLGPLPQVRTTTQTSSYRLAASLSAGTGMREDEVVNLTIWDILNLRPSLHQSGVQMKITKTKGLRPRRVFIPLPIYDDLLHYIQNERRDCVAGRSDTNALFVNHSNSRRNPGRPLTAHTLWRHFHGAVVELGLTRTVVADSRDSVDTKEKALHSFHDLRHTFAVVMYHQLKIRGKSAPWLVLSRLLGHRHVSTTLNTYLRSVDDVEAEITDLINTYIRTLRDA